MQETARGIIGLVALALAAAACGEGSGGSAAPGGGPERSAAPAPAPRAPIDLVTDFEKSGGAETPRYDATMAYTRKLAEASPKVHVTRFGTSAQGRDLPLVIVDSNGDTEPEAVRRNGKAVLLLEACLHAGESEGKDAGLMLVRDLVTKPELAPLLDRTTLLFIPIFNVDGHERFGPYNRINQNGPREMGWRTTARNINLNRDFMKADAVEMRAWLTLFNAWLPDFFVDTHTTDGADYQYELTYSIELAGNMDPGVTAWARGYIDALSEAISAAGFAMTPYVMFKNWHDPRSGLVAYASGPRFSQGYTAIQNRPGLLVETHMLKPYATRVRATYAVLEQTMRILGESHDTLRAAVEKADAFAASPAFRAQPFPVSFDTTEKSRTVEFLGVEYTVKKSSLSGGDWFEYSDVKTTFEVPYFDEIVPADAVRVPLAYLVPPEWDDVIDRLSLHGVKLSRLPRETESRIRTYELSDVSFSPGGWFGPPGQPYEGRQLAVFDLEPIEETRVFPAGTALVETAQRTARVVAHLLEPKAPDSFARWGFFNAIFQRTEYAESYVMEKLARRMLDENPALAAQFAAAKKESPALAKNPEAILDWFYERTPYFDTRVGLYPVGIVDDAAALEVLRRVVAAGR